MGYYYYAPDESNETHENKSNMTNDELIEDVDYTSTNFPAWIAPVII